jgi:lysozyme
MIALEEGRVLSAYYDQAGIRTVCEGHVIRPEDEGLISDGVTNEDCDMLLSRDLDTVEEAINGSVLVPISQNQFDALLVLGFNIGVGGLNSSTTLRLLNAGDYQGAADAMLMWNKIRVKGKFVVNDGLTNRRARERTLFLTPDSDLSSFDVWKLQFDLTDELDLLRPTSRDRDA